MNKFFNILLILILMCLGWHIYRILNYKYISIKFDDLRPVREKIEIYYKGIKIGHVRNMKFCSNCKNTVMHCVLTYKGLMLPTNTTALMKKEKKKDKEYDFIELQYPANPSNIMLANGTVLYGRSTVDVVHFMTNQNGNELEEIKNNIAKSTEDLELVLSSLSEVFDVLQDILKQNQNNIYQSTSNFSQTTDNLKQLMQKVDTSVSQNELEQSILSLNQAADNLKTMTETFSTTGSSLNDATLPQVQSALHRAECLVANSNEIVCGVKETMKKPFGLFRVMFGAPISSKNVKFGKNKCNNR